MSGVITEIADVIQSIDRDHSHRVLLIPTSSTGWGTHSRITHKLILSASLRYRLLSETRVAVCLILGPVFVLWQKRFSEEGMTGISMFVCTDDMEGDGCSRYDRVRTRGRGAGPGGAS
jgi:hypothetical protein